MLAACLSCAAPRRISDGTAIRIAMSWGRAHHQFDGLPEETKIKGRASPDGDRWHVVIDTGQRGTDCSGGFELWLEASSGAIREYDCGNGFAHKRF